MDQSTLNLFVGVGSIAAVLGLLIAIFLQHKQISKLVETVQLVNSNPAVINAIKGATEGIPQDAFDKALSALATGRMFAPSAEATALLDQLATFIKEIDKRPENDAPHPPTVDAVVRAVAAGMSG